MFTLNKSLGGEQPNDVFESSLVRRKEGIWQANKITSEGKNNKIFIGKNNKIT